MSILVVRLGAMGDVVHALPAVASLKRSFPNEELIWVIKSRWMELLDNNPDVDRVLRLEDQASAFVFWKRLRSIRPRLAIDFQGLLQSAVIGRLSRPQSLCGFDATVAREPFASHFYNQAVHVTGPHRIERNLQLVRAIGASSTTDSVSLPMGREEGNLPMTPFVLASPFAGWAGKQWPLDNYEQLASFLGGQGVPLVMNVPLDQVSAVRGLPNVLIHVSSIAGLIHATRRAAAVIGVDSGPLHIAAGLSKPGVAIFGPTDPTATGPYGGSMQVLRTPGAETTYDRHKRIQTSMHAIEPQTVFASVMHALEAHVSRASGRQL